MRTPRTQAAIHDAARPSLDVSDIQPRFGRANCRLASRGVEACRLVRPVPRHAARECGSCADARFRSEPCVRWRGAEARRGAEGSRVVANAGAEGGHEGRQKSRRERGSTARRIGAESVTPVRGLGCCVGYRLSTACICVNACRGTSQIWARSRRTSPLACGHIVSSARALKMITIKI